jgi:hypothetical protein
MPGSSTTTSKAEPWKKIQPQVEDVAQQAQNLYESGGFAASPYSGPRVANFSGATQRAQQAIMDRAAGGAPLVDQAQGFLTNAMNTDYGSRQLEAVKENAIGSAVPAAASMFSGSGMTNSSMAMDTVGRAATDAVAPYEYGAYESMNNRAMQAAGMAPAIERAGFLPAQMMQQVGAARDMRNQAVIDAKMGEHYEREGVDAANLSGYHNIISQLAGMGGQSTQTTQQNPGAGQMIGTGLQAIAMLSMLSDRRAKKDIKRIGKVRGNNLYSFKYKGDETIYVGVMADEVPHAIAGQINGFNIVDYARV